jgi:putative phosphoesterase
VIGLISDTHGLVRPGVHQALEGVELILHAGDVGGSAILDELRLIAPVRAVFGNTDPPGDPELAEEIVVEIGGLRVHVSHGHEVGSPTPARLAARYDADVVVYGHTHRPLVTPLDGRLFVNPGAAGPKRFNIAPTVGKLIIVKGKAEVELIDVA